MSRRKETKSRLLKSGVARLVLDESGLFRLLVITAAIFAVMSVLNPDRFLAYGNFTSMCFQFPELGVLALAIMVSLITGGIDLSIVSIANLAGLSGALVLVRAGGDSHTGLWLAIALCLTIGVSILCGVLNGWLIGYMGITPILATLGTMQLFMGIGFVVTKGHAIAGYPHAFQVLGSGTALYVPVPLLVFLACALAVHTLMSRTTTGMRLSMMGSNPTAAVFAGLKVPRLQLQTYVLSGLLAGIAGLIIIARTNSAKADYGSSYLLLAVLVAILGGVNPRGGFGTVRGILLAVLALQFLSSGLNMLRFHETVGAYINNFTKEFTWGGLLLLVMVMNQCCRSRGLYGSNGNDRSHGYPENCRKEAQS